MTEFLPGGWATTTLGELCDYVTSGSRDWSQYYSIEGAALFVRTQDINQNRLASLDEIARVALPERVEGKRTRVELGDLLITITGANVGKCAFVSSTLPEAYVSQSVALVRLKKGLCGRFIQRQLIAPSSNNGRSLLQESAYGVGRPVLNLDNVRETPILLAPLDEQERVSDKLDWLSAKVEGCLGRLGNASQTLSRFRQAVLAAACSGRLTADWRATSKHGKPEGGVIDNVAKHLGLDRNEVQRKTCDLNCDGLPVIPELPESWTWIPASCLYTDARYGTSVKCEKELAGGVAVLRVPNIARGVLDVTDLKFARLSGAEMARLVVKEGDIVVCRTNGSLDLIGKAAVIPRSPTDYAFASYLIRLRLEQSLVLPKYFHCLISSALGRGQIQARARTTAGQFNLNLEILGSLAVALPSTEEQAEIVSRVDRLLTLADLIEERVMKAASCSGSLTQSILAKAFRGELVPTEAELARRERRDYEPASVLLERIKAEKVSLDSRKALRTKRPAPRSGKRSTVSA